MVLFANARVWSQKKKIVKKKIISSESKSSDEEIKKPVKKIVKKSLNDIFPGNTKPMYKTIKESINWEITVLPVLLNQMYFEPVRFFIKEKMVESSNWETRKAAILPTMTICAWPNTKLYDLLSDRPELGNSTAGTSKDNPTTKKQ